MSALEQSFRDICARHNLRAFSLHCSEDTSEDHRFYAYAHPAKVAGCVSGNGPTIAGALADTLAKLSKPILLADEALPVEIAA